MHNLGNYGFSNCTFGNEPKLGMLLSPDPVLQQPGNPLNYNRYSYVLNNPLRYTDPSGYQLMPQYPDREVEIGNPGGGSMTLYAILASIDIPHWYEETPNPVREKWETMEYIKKINIDEKLRKQLLELLQMDPKRATSVVSDIKKDGYIWVRGYSLDNELNKIINGVIMLGSVDIIETKVYISPLNNASGGGDVRGNDVVKIAEIVNTAAELTGTTSDASMAFLGTTKAGSNLASIIAYTKLPLKIVNSIPYVSFAASTLGFASDAGLSYYGEKSWTETGLNLGVSATAMSIGGWCGVALQLDYMAAKAYWKTIQTHPEYAPSLPWGRR